MTKYWKNRDVLSGLLFVLIGVFVAIKAYVQYPVGAVGRMGPGYFPLILGVALAFIGVAVIALSFKLTGLEIKANFRLRSVLSVLLGVLLFSQTVERLGLIPAALGLCLVAAAAEKPYQLGRTLLLGLFLGVLTWLIFVLGLEMNLSAFAWRIA